MQDLEQIEEWNEFGELKENIGPTPSLNTAPSGPSSADLAAKPAQTSNTLAPSPSSQPGAALRQLGTEAAAVANAKKTGGPILPKPGVDSSKIRPLPSGVAAAPAEAVSNPDLPSGVEREKEKEQDIAVNTTETETPLRDVSNLSLDDAATKPEKMTSSADAKSASVALATENAKEAEKVEGKGTDIPEEAKPSADMGGTLQPPKAGQALAAQSQDNLAAVGLSAEEKKGPGEEQMQHRRSSVNLADEEEVKQVEKATAIPENKEEEADGDEKDSTIVKKGESLVGGTERKNGKDVETNAMKEEASLGEDGAVKTQDQKPAEAEKAGESVQD